jgi:hypothetical protein
MENKKCSICGRRYKGFGNNAQPINDGRCCDYCNQKVIVERLIRYYKRYDSKKEENEQYAKERRIKDNLEDSLRATRQEPGMSLIDVARTVKHIYSESEVKTLADLLKGSPSYWFKIDKAQKDRETEEIKKGLK